MANNPITYDRLTRDTYQIANGLMAPFYETWNKFGYNSDVDAAASETIWEAGGQFVPLQNNAAEQLELVSTSVNDTFGGTGAEGIVVYGVNSDWNNTIEVVFLNGTTPVTTANTYYGINRLAVWRAGSLQQNDGDITATAPSVGSVQGYMPATQGTTQQCIFHVPENTTFLVDWLWINARKLSGGTAPRITVYGYVFSYVSNATYEVYRGNFDTALDNVWELNPSQPFVIGEKSVLYFDVETNTSNTVVSARFSGVERVTNVNN